MNASSWPIVVLGGGPGGVRELSQRLDDKLVSWALLRFQVGGGTFLRTKLIAIRCSGEDMPMGRRGLLNARGDEVLRLLGKTHANLEVTRARELTVDYLCQRLLPLFAGDNLNLSLQDLEQEFARVEAEALARRRARAKFGRQLNSTEVLRAVGAKRGPYNWALFEASTLALHGAGCGGLDELKAEIKEDKVLFGVLRLSFGRSTGQDGQAAPGITKHVFVHWIGPSVSAVKRGIWNARLKEAAALIGEQCAVTVRREAHSLQDINLGDIIAELRRLTVVDTALADRLSAEEYLAALEEDAQEHQREADQWDCEKAFSTDLDEATRMVRSPSGDWNWVLCGCEAPKVRHSSGGS